MGFDLVLEIVQLEKGLGKTASLKGCLRCISKWTRRNVFLWVLYSVQNESNFLHTRPATA